jgi:hypothetical protein
MVEVVITFDGERSAIRFSGLNAENRLRRDGRDYVFRSPFGEHERCLNFDGDDILVHLPPFHVGSRHDI